MKKLWVVSLLVLSTSSFAEVVDKTVAIVGKEVILKSDVDEVLAHPALKVLSADEALAALVEKSILKADCKTTGNYPSEADLKQTIADVKKQNHLDDTTFLVALQRSGTNLAAYQEQMSTEICKTRIVHSKIRGRVNITQDDVKRAYEQEFGKGKNVKLHVREMNVKVAKEAKDKPATLKKAQELAQTSISNLRAGQKWESVLAQAQKHGLQVSEEDLGTLARKDLVATVADSIFGEGSDNYRGPVQTDDGFHVLEILERVEGTQIALVDVEKDLHKQLFEKEVERLLRQYVEEAKSSVYIDVIGMK
jgi:peptidyl-prolyl cis-trans isomerase SurA